MVNDPKFNKLYLRESLVDGSTKMMSIIFYDNFLGVASLEESGFEYIQIAHLEDFGNGLELYTVPEAGGGLKPDKLEELSDEKIKEFVEIAKQMNLLEEWKEVLKSSEDLSSLPQSEKDRILQFITL